MRSLIIGLLVVWSALAQNYSNIILATPGLVGYWRMGEASGNFADSSASGSTATASGTGITYAATGALSYDSNKAVTLNGSTGNAQVSNQTPYNFNFNSTFSVECWVKLNVLTGNYACASKMNSAGTLGWEFHIFQTQLQILMLNTAAIKIELDTAVRTLTSTSTWTHVAFTYTGSGVASGVAIYVNGLPVTSTTVVANSLAGNTIQNAVNVTLGSRLTSCCFLSGGLDEVAIYNTTLTAAQIYQHYVAGIAAQPFPMQSTSTPPNIIFDDDGASDEDNKYGWWHLLQWAKLGYANILGAIVSDNNVYGAPCIDLMARYAGVHVPLIGAYQGSAGNGIDAFGCQTYVTANLPGITRANYTDSAVAYRTLLTAAPNNSVTLILDGGAVSLYNFLNDGGSPSGSTLITSKVTKACWGAGGYPGPQTGYNFGGTIPTYATNAHDVLLGNGSNILVWPSSSPWDFLSEFNQSPASGGATVVQATTIYPNTRLGYLLHSLCPSGCQAGNGRSSWGDMAILDCVYPSTGYFTPVGSNGTNTVNASTGSNTWTSTPNAGVSWSKNVYSDWQLVWLMNLFDFTDSHPWGATWQ